MAELNVTVQKIVISALLLTTITDVIKGFSLDIFVPLVDTVIPGDIKTPLRIGNVHLFVTRFIIRLTNMFFALLVVYLLQKTKTNVY